MVGTAEIEGESFFLGINDGNFGNDSSGDNLVGCVFGDDGNSFGEDNVVLDGCADENYLIVNGEGGKLNGGAVVGEIGGLGVGGDLEEIALRINGEIVGTNSGNFSEVANKGLQINFLFELSFGGGKIFLN